MLTKGSLPRESGGPGASDRDWPPWISAFAGMTRTTASKRRRGPSLPLLGRSSTTAAIEATVRPRSRYEGRDLSYLPASTGKRHGRRPRESIRDDAAGARPRLGCGGD